MAKKKKAAKKKSAGPLPPNGKWFTKKFSEGAGSDPVGRKRKFIEEFYRGYLHAYNDAHPLTKFKILPKPDGFIWTVTQNGGTKAIHQVEVYITPPPIPPPPGGATATDPPTPSKPPPEMT
jgi:hypothetical protein